MVARVVGKTKRDILPTFNKLRFHNSKINLTRQATCKMWWFSHILSATLFLVAVSLAESVLAAKALVQLEVVFEPGLAANAAAQKWTKVFGDLGLAGVRFRTLQNGDQIGIKSEGIGDSAIYQVTALLNN